MIVAEPCSLRCHSDKLAALANDVRSYSIDEQHGRVSAVWLIPQHGLPLILNSISHDVVFKFEVFTLQIRSPAEVLQDANLQRPFIEKLWAELEGMSSPEMTILPLAPVPNQIEPSQIQQWPFKKWQTFVVWVFDYSVPVKALREDWYGKDQPFGVVPESATDACLVATGLLFSGEDGRRLLIEQGEMPLDLLVTQDEEVIASKLKGTRLVAITGGVSEVPQCPA